MKKLPLKSALFGTALAISTTVMAEAMPWEGPICKIANSFSGPVATAFVVLAVVLCGAMLAFGEMNGIFKTLLGVAIGGAMAVGAIQWTTMFTGATKMGCLTASVDAVTMVAQVSERVVAMMAMMV